MRRSRVRVEVDNRQLRTPLDEDHLSKLLSFTLVAQRGDSDAEVGLAFVDVDEMTKLNVTHMGGSGPTDVLSFPIDGVRSANEIPDGQPAILGDIVICPDVAANAAQPLADELALLVVHGALHLLGHDHAEPDESALMKRAEREMLDRFHRP